MADSFLNDLDIEAEAERRLQQESTVEKTTKFEKTAAAVDEFDETRAKQAKPAEEKAGVMSKVNTAGDIAGKAASAIGKGMEDLVTNPATTAMSVGQGLINGVHSTGRFVGQALDAADDMFFGDMLGINTEEKGVFQFDDSEAPRIIDEKDQQPVHKLTETMSQFLVGLKGVDKIAKLSKLSGVLDKAGKVGKTGKFLLENGMADMVAFSEHEDRFFNVIKDAGMQNEVVDYMAANPKDSTAEARFKQFLEGAVMGGAFKAIGMTGKKVFNMLFESAQAFRSARVVKSIDNDVNGIIKKVGDAEPGKALPEGNAPLKREKPDFSPEDLPSSKTSRRKAINEVFDQVSTGKELSKQAKATQAYFHTKYNRELLTDEAFAKAAKDSEKATDFKKLSYTEKLEEAEKLGVDYTEFSETMRNFDDPKMAEEYVTRASKQYVYQKHLVENFNKLRDTLGPEDKMELYEEMMMFNQRVGDDASRRGQMLGVHGHIASNKPAELRAFEISTDMAQRDIPLEEQMKMLESNLDALDGKVIRDVDGKVVDSVGDLSPEGARKYKARQVWKAFKSAASGVDERLENIFFTSLLSNPKTAFMAGLEGFVVRPTMVRAIDFFDKSISKVAVAAGGESTFKDAAAKDFYNTFLKELPNSLKQVGKTFATGKGPTDIPASAFKKKINIGHLQIFEDMMIDDPKNAGTVWNALLKAVDFPITAGARLLPSMDAGISRVWYLSSIKRSAHDATETFIKNERSSIMMEAQKALKAGGEVVEYVEPTTAEKQAILEYFTGNPTKDMFKKARTDIERATLTAPLPKGSAIRMLGDAINAVPIARRMIPFYNVAGNIVDQTIRHTPLRGAMQMLPMGAKSLDSGKGLQWQNAFKKEWAGATKGEKRRITAEVMAGTSVITAATALYSGGMLTGAGPKNWQGRQSLPPDWQPNSLRFGDTYIGIEKLGPIGNMLKIGAIWGEAMDRADYYGERGVEDVNLGITSSALYMTMTSGMVPSMMTDTFPELMEIMNGGAKAEDVERFFVKKIIPHIHPATSLTRQANKFLDPVSRSSLSFGKEDPMSILEKEISKVLPGQELFWNGKQLPVRKNLFGDEIGYNMPTMYKAVSPLKGTKNRYGKVHEKLIDMGYTFPEAYVNLKEVEGDEPYKLTFPQRKIKFGGKRIDLAPHEYGRYIDLAAGKDLDVHPFAGTEYADMTMFEMFRDQIENDFPLADIPESLKDQEKTFKGIQKKFRKSALKQLKNELDYELSERFDKLDEMKSQFLDADAEVGTGGL